MLTTYGTYTTYLELSVLGLFGMQSWLFCILQGWALMLIGCQRWNWWQFNQVDHFSCFCVMAFMSEWRVIIESHDESDSITLFNTWVDKPTFQQAFQYALPVWYTPHTITQSEQPEKMSISKGLTLVECMALNQPDLQIFHFVDGMLKGRIHYMPFINTLMKDWHRSGRKRSWISSKVQVLPITLLNSIGLWSNLPVSFHSTSMWGPLIFSRPAKHRQQYRNLHRGKWVEIHNTASYATLCCRTSLQRPNWAEHNFSSSKLLVVSMAHAPY